MQAASTLFTSYEALVSLPMAMLALFGVGAFLIDRLLPADAKWLNGCVALAGLAFAAAAVFKIQKARAMLEARGLAVRPAFHGSVVVDRFALCFFYLLLAGAAICVLIAIAELRRGKHQGAFYAALLLSLIGMMAMACGADLLLLFVALELTSVCTWLLCVLPDRRQGAETSARFFLSSAFSSALLALGIAFLYGLTGTTNLEGIGRELALKSPHHPLAILGLLFTSAGLLFKLAAAPFHSWALRIWEGAPASVAALVTVPMTLAGWAMTLRIFVRMLYSLRPVYVPEVLVVSVASMAIGSFAALFEKHPRRVLGFGAVAHTGFLLSGLIAGSTDAVSLEGIRAMVFYVAAYAIATLGVFSMLARLPYGTNHDWREGVGIERPRWESALLIVFLCSLAGMPLFAGFPAKLFLFRALIEGSQRSSAIVAMICAVICCLAYLRLVRSLFVPQERRLVLDRAGTSLKVALAATAAATIIFGLCPGWLTRAVDWSLSAPQAAANSRAMRR